MKAKNLFQYVITNKKVEVARKELISIFNKELLKE
jgi:guanylate kinase